MKYIVFNWFGRESISNAVVDAAFVWLAVCELYSLFNIENQERPSTDSKIFFNGPASDKTGSHTGPNWGDGRGGVC